MKYFNWDEDKNNILKQERGISFEEIVYYIQKGNLLDIIENPNNEKYKNQKVFIDLLCNHSVVLHYNMNRGRKLYNFFLQTPINCVFDTI